MEGESERCFGDNPPLSSLLLTVLQEYCVNRRFKDSDLVYQAKLLAFLQDVVLQRAPKTSRQRKGEIRETRKTLVVKTVKLYTAGITHLGKTQQAKGLLKPSAIIRGELVRG